MNFKKILQISSGHKPKQGEISYEIIKDIQKKSPRRICFNSHHRNSLKREDGEYKGKFSIPFLESIYPIFYEVTEVKLYRSKLFGNYWRSIKDQKVYERIRKFIAVTRDLVFLRDSLALSITLGENFDKDGKYTNIGKCEYYAKYKDSQKAKDILKKKCIKFINNMPFYCDAELICAVPSSIPGEMNLPIEIVESIKSEIQQRNISSFVSFNKEKPPLKNLNLEHKWKNLDSVDLSVEIDLEGKNVILIDDLYQSGTTMQYVAMKLLEKGAGKIFGLCFVKSRGDSDNN